MPTRKKRGNAAQNSSDASGSSGPKKRVRNEKTAFCGSFQHLVFPLCVQAFPYHTSPCRAAQEAQAVFGAFYKRRCVFSCTKAKSAPIFTLDTLF
jgi:hypothetical protein